MVSKLKLDMIAKKARGLIKRHGWMVQAVLPGEEDDGVGFSYTVGLSSRFGHPEVFLVGFAPDLSQQLLNIVGNHVRDGLRFAEPVFSDVVIQSFPVAFRPATTASAFEHSNAGRYYLGHSFEAVQLFLPDPSGLFPWDEGCSPQYARMQNFLELVGDPPQPGARAPGPH